MDQFPHSIAIWFRWEILERQNDGLVTGSPKDSQNYSGMIHCQNRECAKQQIEQIINNLKKELEDANQRNNKKD
jgi:hypothetical protein